MRNFHDAQVLGEIANLIEDIRKVSNHTFVFHTPDLAQSVRDLERNALFAIENHIHSHVRSGNEPLIKDADPELERLLAEEEEIERQTRRTFEQDWEGNR